MTLYEMMLCGKAYQKHHVYITNIYDQNIELGHGIRKQIMDEDEGEAFEHLVDEVDTWTVAKDGSVVICVRDSHFYERAEEQYSPAYVSRWDNLKPETRPWKHSCELEDFET